MSNIKCPLFKCKNLLSTFSKELQRITCNYQLFMRLKTKNFVEAHFVIKRI